MDDLYHVAAGLGYHQVLDEETAGLKWLAFGVLRLNAGDTWQAESKDEEIALVTMSGQCAVNLEGIDAKSWDCVGGRANVFGGRPHAFTCTATSVARRSYMTLVRQCARRLLREKMAAIFGPRTISSRIRSRRTSW